MSKSIWIVFTGCGFVTRTSTLYQKVRRKKAEVRSQKEDGRTGTVRTSVTLLGQDMGNTLLLIVYTSFVSSVVLFGRISARIKLLAERSIWPRSSRPNQTSITFCVIGLSPTDQPA